MSLKRNPVPANLQQFIKFAAVGISNMVVNLAVYYFLLYFGINYLIANFFGFCLSVLNAYYWNNKYVFNKTEYGNTKPLIKTFLSYGSTFLLGTGFLFVMVHYLHIAKTVAPVINIAITTPINFVLNKYWTFK